MLLEKNILQNWKRPELQTTTLLQPPTTAGYAPPQDVPQNFFISYLYFLIRFLGAYFRGLSEMLKGPVADHGLF